MLKGILRESGASDTHVDPAQNPGLRATIVLPHVTARVVAAMCDTARWPT